MTEIKRIHYPKTQVQWKWKAPSETRPSPQQRETAMRMRCRLLKMRVQLRCRVQLARQRHLCFWTRRRESDQCTASIWWKPWWVNCWEIYLRLFTEIYVYCLQISVIVGGHVNLFHVSCRLLLEAFASILYKIAENRQFLLDCEEKRNVILWIITDKKSKLRLEPRQT